MKNIIVLLLLSITFFGGITAQPVSKAEAEKAGRNFFYERINQYRTTGLEQISIKDYFIIGENASPVYYVFNISPVGYVMVSGSRNAWPVPAYSLTSGYSGSNLPPQFTAWVKQYHDQILFAQEYNTTPTEGIHEAWNRLLSDDPSALLNLKGEKQVLPMLISTWDQGQFYDQMCPADPAGPGGHCLTGCVATAMGQLCYYFRWPLTGTGSYTYEHPTYGTISADFGETNYNWHGMTNAVNEQNDAVAELLFHLGVSVDMDYGPSGSGMYNHKAAYSLRTFFNYAPETEYLFRDSTNLDWDSVIVAHLDRKIPMYYAGWSVPNINGHAFIVDGYQTEDYFHFNWGWGGSYDGYFYLDNLTPGGNLFNLAQELVINCYPDTLNFTYPYFCDSPDTLKSLNGSIDDGSGPIDNYLNNTNCSWLITPQTPEDSVSYIVLEFDRFETSNQDILSVYDGNSTDDPLIGQFSGNSFPDVINSTGNEVLITFQTDNEVTAGGWFLSYTSVRPVWCSGMSLLSNQTDTISDGSLDFNYRNSSVCMWNIQPPGASDVTINFLNFNTEENKDLVKIYNAANSQLLATYSGAYEPDELPDPITSPSGKMLVTFLTNLTVTKSGWSAYYTSNGVGISNPSITEAINIYPNPFQNELFFEMNFDTPQSVVIEVYNIEGKLVQKTDTGHFEGEKVGFMNMQGLGNGIFTVKIIGRNSVYQQKLVKIK